MDCSKQGADTGATVIHYVNEFYNRMVAGKRIDVQADKQERKPSKNGKDLQTIDVDSIRNKDVREVGSEWLTYQATLNSN